MKSIHDNRPLIETVPMKAFNKLLSGEPAGSLIIGALILFLSLAAELLVFNHHFFYGKSGHDSFAHRAFELPVHEQYKVRALVMNGEANELTLNDLRQKIANVQLTTTANYGKAVTMTLHVRFEGDDFRPVSSTRINPADTDQNTALLHLNNSDSDKVVTGLKVTATANSAFIFALTGLEINVPEPLNLSWVRMLGMMAILGVFCAVLRFRLYRLVFDESRIAHRVADYGVLALALGICTFFFWATHPSNCLPWIFDVNGEGVYPVTSLDRTLLYKLPESIEETSNAGAYDQLLAALLKGKVNINVFVDPALKAVDNPWDPSARILSGARYTFDRPYYEGRYFVYFGIAPLIMVFAPVYALTGMVPSPALSMYLMSIMAVMALLWAYRTMVRVYAARPNMLIYMSAQVAAMCGTLIWMLYVGLSFYYLPYLAAMTWLSVFLASLYSLLTPARHSGKEPTNSTLRTRLMLLVAGISVPMLVSSRPLVLIFMIVLSIPAIALIIRENYTDRDTQLQPQVSHTRRLLSSLQLSALLKDSLFTAVPVLIGAVLIMYYNYIRFDSISEFGQTYQFTGDDVRSKGIVFGIAHLKNVLFNFFAEPLVWVREFPFVFANSTSYNDYGNMLSDMDRISLFTLPVFWSLFLALRSHRTLSALAAGLPSSGNDQEMTARMTMASRRTSALRYSTALTAAAMVFLAYLSYYNAGLFSRYLNDIATPCSYLALVLTVLNFGTQRADTHVTATPVSAYSSTTGSMDKSCTDSSYSWSHSALYALAMFLLLKTAAIGLLISFSYSYNILPHMGTIFNEMNPELMVDMYRIFTPFGH